MGGRVASSSKSGKFRGSLAVVLASALLEWLLIFMLIVYAIFGYLITRFARFCELPIPCLLCSRIDNILGGEEAGFYWDMICGNHKLEISSLVYCHFHEKLVDVRGMCETCLFSFATKDKSNAETYRLLVGKLGEEDLSAFDDETVLDDHLTKTLKHCSCCNGLWNPRRQCHAQTLFQTKSTDFNGSLYGEASQDFDSLKKETLETQAASTIIHVREMTEDSSAHFGYTDLKITSDNESDIQDSLEKEAEKTQASPTIIHVKEKMEDSLLHFGFTELKITSDSESDLQASDIHDRLEDAKITQLSSTIIHVRDKSVDPLDHFGFTDLKITSDNESDIHESSEDVKKSEASSTIIHVREKTEDPLVYFGFTELKTVSDSESDIHESSEEVLKSQESSTIIHVREKTEDPFVHFGFTEMKTVSDSESDVRASDIHNSLSEAKESQVSSTIIHVKEKMEDPLLQFGFTELKTASDNESDIQTSDIQISDIHDSLEEAEKTQASSTIFQVREIEDHFGFTERKSTSDNEYDIEVEDASTSVCDDHLRDLIVESTQVGSFISISEDVSAKKPIYLDDLSQASLDLAPSDIIQPHDHSTSVQSPAIGHGLEELNWQGIDHKPNVSDASMELINVIDDIPNPLVSTEMVGDEVMSSTQNGASLDCSKGELDANEATPQTVEHVIANNQATESLQTTSILNSSEHSDLQTPNYLDLSDAYKLAVSSRARQTSEKLSEQLTGKNSSNINLDLKLLLSQFSRGLNLPSTGILSPRVSRNFDDLKTSDSLTMKLLQKRASLERNDSRNSIDRNESGIESLDFSTVSEIEGETEHDRLKRQVEHDRRFMIALLKELEEERNASASATNEAMAMITRIQEEKAALQMEASHHLRMMEEQAEYDMDALDKLNDLVTDKEKEIENLESQLDYYRVKYPNDDDEKSPSHDPWLLTQDEREYLSECLRNLEKKLSLISKEPGHELKSETEEDENGSIVNEVSRLNERLQALEADRTFIEHAINALNDGQEELIQEIASHLRELHKLGIRRYQIPIEDKDILVER